MKDKFSNTLWGLFFVIIGIGFAGNVIFGWDFNLFFPGWWTLFIIIPSFISMIRNGFGTGSTVFFIIGVILLANEYVDLDFSIWRLVIPAILIFIGIRIMFQSTFRKKPEFFEHNFNTNPGGPQGQTYTSGTRQEYNAIFSGNRVRITDTFYGASMNAVFGSVVLDLRDAQIPGNIEISAQAIFGGIDIFVPAGVNVKVNNVPVFGGVSNRAMQSNDPSAPTIYLNSTCMFGGIDIK